MEPKKTLILLAGAPGTGKSYTGQIIRQAFPSLMYTPLDMFKEHIYDEIGFDNLSQKSILDEEARQRFYQAIDLMMGYGKQILGDYPFSYKQKPYLEKIANKNNYQVITIRLEAPVEILYQRQRNRDQEEQRHLGHLMNHYHRDDVITSDVELDGMPTMEVFKKRMKERKYSNFSLGKLLRIDVSDYSQINYLQLIRSIEKIAGISAN
ncbi:AAA family ATPase [Ligilactobacillus sp. WILCCON 0076]|uniref:UDP-N-acetylglucosamine kinase n=1 Tax=Ligilactobacillus ubinensis TaxID=2876789 RepID=A0A9X2JLI1_9LACO|nr:AAA family ATPase [Ligilactobacillus ubinensis]MCP0887037.1 AAA family ATPase [Ligilactobacillus ubinensis]